MLVRVLVVAAAVAAAAPAAAGRIACGLRRSCLLRHRERRSLLRVHVEACAQRALELRPCSGSI